MELTSLNIICFCDKKIILEKMKEVQTSRKPSVLPDRNAVGPTISKYISDQMSGKT